MPVAVAARADQAPRKCSGRCGDIAFGFPPEPAEWFAGQQGGYRAVARSGARPGRYRFQTSTEVLPAGVLVRGSILVVTAIWKVVRLQKDYRVSGTVDGLCCIREGGPGAPFCVLVSYGVGRYRAGLAGHATSHH